MRELKMSFRGAKKGKWMLRLQVERPGNQMGQVRRFAFCDSGSSVVEFALSASVLLAMLFGVFEISLALYSYHFVDEAAREAARYASVRGSKCVGMPDCGFTDSNTTLVAYVQTLHYPGIDSSKLTVTSTWYSPSGGNNPTWTLCGSGVGCNIPLDPPNNVSGDMVKVQVSYPFLLSIPFWAATTLNFTSS